ncbi:hypothetical protein OG864_01010 [Streptomyces sp. NBC_00124]|uniref:hypothetical protein n=1 Tax=Streptomyces sp. NBC_00124 TaxID=2975662 RepID=UPI002251AD76|nr:hypothetical protein [Streptomyces sp. NBC_00124]MCX5357360.1 hypothetical protein [Streptomyces sp. NBC_00124]
MRGTSLSSPRTIARRFSREAGRANTSSTEAHSASNSPSSDRISASPSSPVRTALGGSISPTNGATSNPPSRYVNNRL